MPSQIAPGLEIVSRGHGKLVFINCSEDFFEGGNSLEIYTQAFCKANEATTTPFDADFVKFSYETQVHRHFKEGDTELDLLLQQDISASLLIELGLTKSLNRSVEGEENKEKLHNHRGLAPPDPDIVPVSATLSTHFSDRGFTIVSFAKMLIGKNAARNATIELNRSDVTINWEMQVRYAFARYTPERNFYLDQVNCPLFHEFWLQKENQLTFEILEKAQKAETGYRFHKTLRLVTQDEERIYGPGTIFMQHNEVELIVPGIMLCPLEHLHFEQFVDRILDANVGKMIDHPRMVLLFYGIIKQVYHFEPESLTDKKYYDVQSLQKTQTIERSHKRPQEVQIPDPALSSAIPLPAMEKATNVQDTANLNTDSFVASAEKPVNAQTAVIPEANASLPCVKIGNGVKGIDKTQGLTQKAPPEIAKSAVMTTPNLPTAHKRVIKKAPFKEMGPASTTSRPMKEWQQKAMQSRELIVLE
ncbi:MAG: hypothetical protein Q9164_003752 [Protoblastenia rupestris]